ncbi:MAG: DEAD/DEAH box helicase, partial [Desulfobacterales bacterium]|nr:DEAD/DEAH box helicase [Desulfobacterales bacterium]
RLVADDSGNYRSSLLFMESLLRKTTPTGDKLYIGRRAAMDHAPYQFDAAIQALKQPRQRILIADAVGLGKTIEAGILLSELIRRGRGKRILVLAVKSMLTQFQKEMWSRFTIPLTRLDSIGIQRIRSRIPTNQNPFYYYDKSIISIDTLKQNIEYRTYIENAWWDVIVIDEAHNVARRGVNSSQRSRLARLLSKRSDTLIMLSATPHDGRAASFASLMNMLDPTAISNPDSYGPEDIKGLYIRRFKKDIQHQVEGAFKERRISAADCRASAAEEEAFTCLADLEFTAIDRKKTGGMLFKITLEKALFSSPAACLKTIANRVRRLAKKGDARYEGDIRRLEALAGRVGRISKNDFSRYAALIDIIKNRKTGFGWTGKDPEDRLVIFTERIETLKFLHENLPRDLKLPAKRTAILHGSMSDADQQRVVEAFGKNESPIRLLIASDVASEGINLHYLCHKMIHFDIPWSLMVFQQRNGRIDRYGQERTPRSQYLLTRGENKRIQGDARILELLMEKDEESVKNIGDSAEFLNVHNVEAEERIVADAMARGLTPEQFEATVGGPPDGGEAFDPFTALFDGDEPPVGETVEGSRGVAPSLFSDDLCYFKEVVAHLRAKGEAVQAIFDMDEKRVDLVAPADLIHRFTHLPSEIRPVNGEFVLSADPEVIQEEIKRSRKDEKTWPVIHYLWGLSPVMEWADDKALAAFRRHEAPVIIPGEVLAPREAVFILSGLTPNRKGHPLIHEWVGVRFEEGRFIQCRRFEEIIERVGLGVERFPNMAREMDVSPLEKLLPEAVEKTKVWLSDERSKFEKRIGARLSEKLDALDRLKSRRHERLEKDFETGRTKRGRKRDLAREKRGIDAMFDDYKEWIRDTMTTEDHPYIQVVAVLYGGGAPLQTS